MKTNYFTMTVPPEIAPLQNAARLAQLRLAKAQRRFHAGPITVAAVDEVQKFEADADKTFDVYNDAMKDVRNSGEPKTFEEYLDSCERF
jgi:DNA-binding PucR family transcriptional regulator